MFWKNLRNKKAKRLLQVVFDNSPSLLMQVQSFIDEGVFLDYMTPYNESALRIASMNGRFDVVKLLIENGASKEQLGWSPSFFAIAFEELEDIRASLKSHNDIEYRGSFEITPFLFSIMVGDIEKSRLLVSMG